MRAWHIRVLWAYPLFAIMTIIASLMIIITSKISTKATPEVFHFVKYFWAKFVLQLLHIRLHEAVGSEGKKLISGGSYVIVAPHRSILDAVVIATILPNHPNSWVVKEEIFAIPFIGSALKAVGCLSTKRSGDKNAAVQMFEGVDKELREKHYSLVLFASGSRKATTFKNGAFHFAKQYGFPIMPIGIKGTDEILPVNTWWKGKGGIVMFNIHKPFWLDDMSVEEARDYAQQLVG